MDVMPSSEESQDIFDYINKDKTISSASNDVSKNENNDQPHSSDALSPLTNSDKEIENIGNVFVSDCEENSDKSKLKNIVPQKSDKTVIDSKSGEIDIESKSNAITIISSSDEIHNESSSDEILNKFKSENNLNKSKSNKNLCESDSTDIYEETMAIDIPESTNTENVSESKMSSEILNESGIEILSNSASTDILNESVETKIPDENNEDLICIDENNEEPICVNESKDTPKMSVIRLKPIKSLLPSDRESSPDKKENSPDTLISISSTDIDSELTTDEKSNVTEKSDSEEETSEESEKEKEPEDIAYSEKENKFFEKIKAELELKVKQQVNHCTACFQQVNISQSTDILAHPVLGVIICKKCKSFYGNGQFKQDADGFDEYCRWCANGGDLLICDACTNGFCKVCIKRNVGRSALHDAMNSDEWKCYVCDLTPLFNLRSTQRIIMESAKNLGSKLSNLTRLKKREVTYENKFANFKLQREQYNKKMTKNKQSKYGSDLVTYMADMKELLFLCRKQVEKIDNKFTQAEDFETAFLTARRRFVRVNKNMQSNLEKMLQSYLSTSPLLEGEVLQPEKKVKNTTKKIIIESDNENDSENVQQVKESVSSEDKIFIESDDDCEEYSVNAEKAKKDVITEKSKVINSDDNCEEDSEKVKKAKKDITFKADVHDKPINNQKAKKSTAKRKHSESPKSRSKAMPASKKKKINSKSTKRHLFKSVVGSSSDKEDSEKGKNKSDDSESQSLLKDMEPSVDSIISQEKEDKKSSKVENNKDEDHHLSETKDNDSCSSEAVKLQLFNNDSSDDEMNISSAVESLLESETLQNDGNTKRNKRPLKQLPTARKRTKLNINKDAILKNKNRKAMNMLLSSSSDESKTSCRKMKNKKPSKSDQETIGEQSNGSKSCSVVVSRLSTSIMKELKENEIIMCDKKKQTKEVKSILKSNSDDSSSDVEFKRIIRRGRSAQGLSVK